MYLKGSINFQFGFKIWESSVFFVCFYLSDCSELALYSKQNVRGPFRMLSFVWSACPSGKKLQKTNQKIDKTIHSLYWPSCAFGNYMYPNWESKIWLTCVNKFLLKDSCALRHFGFNCLHGFCHLLRGSLSSIWYIFYYEWRSFRAVHRMLGRFIYILQG